MVGANLSGSRPEHLLGWLCPLLQAAVVLCLSGPDPRHYHSRRFSYLLVDSFLRDEVSPLLKEREDETTIYHPPVGFKNAKTKTNYIGHLKKAFEGIPEDYCG